MNAFSEEYQHIEFKASLSERHEAAISLAAFATARGGEVRFGIDPNGKRVGLQLGRMSLEELANYFKTNTDAPLFPSIAVEGGPSDAVVVVRIEESPIKPVWAFGTPYKRVGRTNQKISREETERLSDASRSMTWDALPCVGLGYEHLDRSAVEDYLRRAGQDTAKPTESVLETLNLASSGSIANGAALLFAADPQRWIVGSIVQCGLFRGTSSVDFLDERTIRATVLRQIDEALAFVARNIRQAIRITGRPQRETVAEYSPEAVREAVINAVCHRDYASAGAVQIRIYEDRLEVWNPGALPPALTIDALSKEHASYPRNKRLAEALHRADLIERWGTGTLRMIEACERSGQPAPEFEEAAGAFIVRFRPAPEIVEEPQDAKDAPILSERLRRALRFAVDHEGITRSRYENVLSVSRRQAARDLGELVARGLLFRAGRSRPVRYVPTDEGVRVSR